MAFAISAEFSVGFSVGFDFADFASASRIAKVATSADKEEIRLSRSEICWRIFCLGAGVTTGTEGTTGAMVATGAGVAAGVGVGAVEGKERAPIEGDILFPLVMEILSPMRSRSTVIEEAKVRVVSL